MKVAAVIPARMQSVRLPGKPALRIAGVPMIIRVLERARACPGLQRIIVATDSKEIFKMVEASGGEAWMTSPKHRTGSDRVAEVAETLTEDFVLNLQGDEPLLPPTTVEALVRFARNCPDLTVVTAMVPLHRVEHIVNPNVVKVVGTSGNKALYFSRYPIPYWKDSPLHLDMASREKLIRHGYYKHLGIYLYRREFLLKFVSLKPTPLEIMESLEQLRILEHGYPVYLVKVDEDSVSVDIPEDVKTVESMLAKQGTRIH